MDDCRSRAAILGVASLLLLPAGEAFLLLQYTTPAAHLSNAVFCSVFSKIDGRTIRTIREAESRHVSV